MPQAFRPARNRPRAMLLAVAFASILSVNTGNMSGTTIAATRGQTVSGPGVALAGDLLTVGGTSVRLYGITAPMAGQTCKTRYDQSYDCFRRATEILQALIGDANVTCTLTATDRNGQQIGTCFANGVNLGAAVVSRGWAFAYRQLSNTYVGAEMFANSHRLGMWAGKIETPTQWRSRHLTDTAR